MVKPTLALCAALLAQPAFAALPQVTDLSLDAANRLAGAAIAACAAQGRAIVVSVVDRGGNLVVVQRADGVGPHNTEASRRKAYTALSTRSATLDLARNAAAEPDTRNLASLPELLLLGGGVPLRVEDQVVGAIGVAGGGGARNDHACALAAVSTLAAFERPSIN
ncbi:GlcG/HbpS family heme-binding protein [Massilia suwonensis]|uniref:Heme-binding protein n=1 Tax=Massilia suwonensis TaxID=648895 RepID=A0ABW0MRZ6_9BURK